MNIGCLKNTFIFILLLLFLVFLRHINMIQNFDISQMKINLNVRVDELLHSGKGLEKHNILFLKTHKCGTSSIVNLFYVFGIRRSLNFVTNPFKRMLDINDTILPPRRGEYYNVQCAHAVYHSDIEDRLLPRNRTFYTTIIRSPVGLFKSSYMFFGGDRRNSDNFNLTLDESVRNYFRQRDARKRGKDYVPLDLVINSASHDLGFGHYLRKNGTMDEKIKQFISQLKKDFDFVMINEYYDESLVLLKSFMNWEYRDILYLNRLVSTSERKKQNLSEEVVSEVLRRCMVDVQLYDAFLDIFHERIAAYGPDKLARDVAYFRKYRLNFEDSCFDKNAPVKGQFQINTWNFSQHGLVDPTCQLLQYPDFKLTNFISHLQVTDDFRYPDRIEEWKKQQLDEESKRLIKALKSDYGS